MKNTILYTGSDMSLYETKEDILHFPLTKLCINEDDAFEVLLELKQIFLYSHIVFTTKYAAVSFIHFLKLHRISIKMLEGIFIIALCPQCIHILEKEGIEVNYVGRDESEQGLIRLLQKMDLTNAKILFPQSGLKKPNLVHFLVEEEVEHKIMILYELKKNLPYTTMNLSDFSQVVFTSPLGVDVFFELFEDLPAHLSVHTMGLMTRCRLKSYLEGSRKKIDKKIYL